MVEKMNERKKRILKAIIHEHILTAEPVGSRTLARSYEFGVSSATIRNEMSDLEELGYLEQPYTSAGRIPSDKGYRFYVDTLVDEGSRLDLDYKSILTKFNKEKEGIQSIMSSMAKMLSRLTRYTSMISEPQIQASRVKQIQLLEVESSSVLIVLITDTGLVHNKIVKLQQGLTNKQLRYLNQFLNDHLQQKELADITDEYLFEMEKKLVKRLDLSQGILQLIGESLTKLSSTVDFKIYLGGTSYILEQPEFNDIQNLKKVMKILDHEEMLRELLRKRDTKGIEVVIGHENELEDMQKCSIVFTTYSIGDKPSGKIAVIGPTRMQYPRVIATVNTVADVIGKIISKLSG